MKLETHEAVCPHCHSRVQEAKGGSLRAARLKARLTLGEMARRSGLSIAYLSDLERGNRRIAARIVALYERHT